MLELVTEFFGTFLTVGFIYWMFGRAGYALLLAIVVYLLIKQVGL